MQLRGNWHWGLLGCLGFLGLIDPVYYVFFVFFQLACRLAFKFFWCVRFRAFAVPKGTPP
jgi:hypothetical protein